MTADPACTYERHSQCEIPQAVAEDEAVLHRLEHRSHFVDGNRRPAIREVRGQLSRIAGRIVQ
jgi:hypothetical protein